MDESIARIFSAALHAVAPARCVENTLHFSEAGLRAGIAATFPRHPCRRVLLLSIGKAAAPMAAAAEKILGEAIAAGLVVTKYGHGDRLRRCRILECGHPVPDENGVAAASAVLDLLAGAGPQDLVLCLLSGGGSALCPAPAEGLSLADKQETTRLLLSCGATIHHINTLRKHLSRLKGGQLCRAAGGARVVSLILSDVIGDDLDIIASGMTAADPSTFADCLDIVHRYDIFDRLPPAVRRRLQDGAAGRLAETPKPGDPLFARVENHIVGSNGSALQAAASEARRLGYQPLILTSRLTGEACQAAKVLAAIAMEAQHSANPAAPPLCLLAGGETTVTLSGAGKGGRNMEFALAAALELAGTVGIRLLAAGTDGNDGPTDAAGALVDGGTVARAAALGLSAAEVLARHDSYPFFEALGNLLITGPTRTNVMDLVIALVDRPEPPAARV